MGCRDRFGDQSLLSVVRFAHLYKKFRAPKIGAPLPLSSMGWPLLNCSRLMTAPRVEDANRTLAARHWNFIVGQEVSCEAYLGNSRLRD
jgi:hypothetical protein